MAKFLSLQFNGLAFFQPKYQKMSIIIFGFFKKEDTFFFLFFFYTYNRVWTNMRANGYLPQVSMNKW